MVPEEGVPVRSVCVSPDGQMLAMGNNKGHAYVWTLGGENGALGAVSFLLVLRLVTARVSLNVITQVSPKARISAHSTYLLKVLFSYNCDHLITASADHTVRCFPHAMIGLASQPVVFQIRMWPTADVEGSWERPSRTLQVRSVCKADGLLAKGVGSHWECRAISGGSGTVLAAGIPIIL